MVKVIKRNGKKVAFNPAKLRRAVEYAARDAKLAPKFGKQIAIEVSKPVIKALKKRKLVKSIDIKKMVLKKLDAIAKPVSDAWRRHDKKKHKK